LNIKFEKEFPVPKEVLWDYLTNEKSPNLWCTPVQDFSFSIGETFTSEQSPSILLSGKFFNTITEFEKYKTLTYESVYKKQAGVCRKCGECLTSSLPKCPYIGDNINSYVTWTFDEKDNKTVLILEHRSLEKTNFIMEFLLKRAWEKAFYSLSAPILPSL